MDWGFFAFLFVASISLVVLVNLRKKLFVPFGQAGLLYREGKFVEQLEPGLHRYTDPLGKLELVNISTLTSVLTPPHIEVISADQFSFRLNVSVLFTITQPQVFHENHPADALAGSNAQFFPDPQLRMNRVYPVLSNAVSAAIAAMPLESFLAANKDALVEIPGQLAHVMPGIEVDDVILTSITLPPELRKMLTEVERAKREGLAALERAKAEQASLRALANAARNMADNPGLAKLRVLQTMESAKGAKTFVLGKDES